MTIRYIEKDNELRYCFQKCEIESIIKNMNYDCNYDFSDIAIYDLLNSKVLKEVKHTNEYILCKKSISSIWGLIMESRIVDIVNNDYGSKKKLFMKSANRKKASRKFLDQFELVGTGLKFTENNYPSRYNPHDSADAYFLRVGHKQEYSSEYKSVQIKASKNEQYLNNTIRDMISGKYDGIVLTVLTFEDGEHSKQKMMEFIKSLKDERKIQINHKNYSTNANIRNKLKNSIIKPEDINILQDEIDKYEGFIYCLIEKIREYEKLKITQKKI